VELEPAPSEFKPIVDRRRLAPEPLPVLLIAIEDVTLPAPAGFEPQLHDFYVGMLGFSDLSDSSKDKVVYGAENVNLRFDLQKDPAPREEYRTLGIQIESINELEHRLSDAQIEYERRRGMRSGSEMIVLRDPAGNWLELSEHAELR
jgi:catechol-2,3-dioxygenase